MKTVKGIKLGSTPLYWNGGVAEPGVETDIPAEIYEQYKQKIQLVGGEEVPKLDDSAQTKTMTLDEHAASKSKGKKGK